MADLAFFAISTQPWRESDLQSNLRDYYSKSGSPLHSGGTVEQTQYCYYGLLPAVGPMYGMIRETAVAIARISQSGWPMPR